VKRPGLMAWALWTVAVALALVSVTLQLPSLRPELLEFLMVSALLGPLYATVGAILASRRPDNALGWLFCLIGLGFSYVGAAVAYADLALGLDRTLRGAMPLAQVAHPVAAVSWGALVTFTLLLFPTGSPPTPRWRWLVWAAALGNLAMAAGLGLFAFRRGGEVVVAVILAGGSPDTAGIERALNEGGHVLVFLGLLGGVAALIVRFRRATGDERRQLKWFLFAAVLTAVAVFAGGALIPDPAGLVMELLALAALPLAIAIAVLRYRLYDIDRIVSRTVSYALLSVVVATVYAGGVLVLSNTLGAGSELSVAAATLAAAAVFSPARRRIQAVVDRRFNRARYDAQAVVADFQRTLRDQVDLDRVGRELTEAAHRTVQPACLSIWVREGSAREGVFPEGPFVTMP
jgi:hypothetical protein